MKGNVLVLEINIAQLNNNIHPPSGENIDGKPSAYSSGEEQHYFNEEETSCADLV